MPHAYLKRILAAQVSRLTELGAGTILVVTAVEVLRRRMAGRIGAQHGYEPALALLNEVEAPPGRVKMVVYDTKADLLGSLYSKVE